VVGIVLVQQATDALGGSIVVIGRVDREQFRDDFGAVGEEAVYVGESAAPIDGEVELSIASLLVLLLRGAGAGR